MIRLSLPYPVSGNRYWRHVVIGRSARTLVSREALAYRETVRAAFAESAIAPLGGDVAVWLWLHPKQTAEGRAFKRRLDLDNVSKVALDALQGLAFTDDAQVVALHARLAEARQGGGLTVHVVPAQEMAA
jgi:crossover junction endodeoxyribonuclease RusA